MQTSVGAFHQAVEKAHLWLKELKEIGQFQNEEQAYSVLRAVLHALRDRLICDEAIHLGSEMPMLIRGLYFEGFDLSPPDNDRTLDSFYETIRQHLRNASFNVDVESATKAVFNLLNERISAGEMTHVKNMLPEEIREVCF